MLYLHTYVEACVTNWVTHQATECGLKCCCFLLHTCPDSQVAVAMLVVSCARFDWLLICKPMTGCNCKGYRQGGISTDDRYCLKVF